MNKRSLKNSRLMKLLQEAWISLVSHKLRTFLTMLGVVIGVGAVVLMVAAGQTVERIIHDQLASMGSNLIVVLPGSTSSSGVRGGLGTTPTLTMQDAEAIALLTGVNVSAPINMGNSQLVYGNENWNTAVVGTTPGYLTVTNWAVKQGNAFSERELRTAANVLLIGETVSQRLFAGDNPLGKTIRVKNVPFQIIGVLEEKGQSIGGSDQDDVVIMPISAARQRIEGNVFRDSVSFILVNTTSKYQLAPVEERITQLLRDRHRILPGQEDDFSVRNLTEIVNTISMVGRVLSLLLAAIASISLLVGSIGIMNMMLVSVSERTREIGIRKAIGAPERSIMLQFLFEAMLISLIGGMVGLFCGVSLSQLGGYLLQQTVPFSLWTVAIAFVVAALVGITAGFFPALKATRLDPIKALRYE